RRNGRRGAFAPLACRARDRARRDVGAARVRPGGREVKELAAALEERARPEGLAWLREASAAVAADPTAIRSRFPMVGRKVGREPLDADADPADVHAWTIDDA